MTKIEWTDRTWTCTACRTEKPLSAFAKDASRANGHTYVCRDCRNAHARQKYEPKARQRRGFLVPTRDGDRLQARDRTWNPVTGCTKVSAGCKHCYAEVMAKRTFGRLYPTVAIGPTLPDGGPTAWRDRRFTDLQCHPDRLDAPLRWRKPSMVFVNSMSDLFHPDVPDEFIDRVFAAMALTPRHTYQILTKRPERMREFMTRASSDALLCSRRSRVDSAIWSLLGTSRGSKIRHGGNWRCAWPLPNVWCGTSVEDQPTADARIPELLATPAAVRFVSYEPALGPVDFCPWIHADWSPTLNWWKYSPVKAGPVIDWIVCGGESGPKARPCQPHWLRQVVEPCRVSQTTKVFVKQLGAHVVTRNDDGWEGDTTRSWPIDTRFEEHIHGYREDYQGAPVRVRLRDRKGGDPSEWPPDLWVREMPDAVRRGGAA